MTVGGKSYGSWYGMFTAVPVSRGSLCFFLHICQNYISFLICQQSKSFQSGYWVLIIVTITLATSSGSSLYAPTNPFHDHKFVTKMALSQLLGLTVCLKRQSLEPSSVFVLLQNLNHLSLRATYNVSFLCYATYLSYIMSIVFLFPQQFFFQCILYFTDFI